MAIGLEMVRAAEWLTLKPNELARKLPQHTPIRFFAEVASVFVAVLAWPILIPLLLIGAVVCTVEDWLGID